jgi:membrane-associated protein
VEHFLDLFNPKTLIQYGGLTFLLIIIFAETGLFLGFFLPGDSLLFIAGVLCGSKDLNVSIGTLIILVTVAAVLGTTAGYGCGHWMADYFKRRKENFFFRKKRLDMARDFYRRYGMAAFIFGRFLPVIRTFIPILAGIVKIDFYKFVLYNFIGALIWVTVMIVSGYWLGNIFPAIADYLEILVIAMVMITSVPLLLSWLRHRHGLVKDDEE